MKSTNLKELELSLFTFNCVKCGFENVYTFQYFEADKFKCKICNKPEKYFRNEFNRIYIKYFVNHVMVFLEVWEKCITNYIFIEEIKRNYLDHKIRYKQILKTSNELLPSIKEFINSSKDRIDNYINIYIRAQTTRQTFKCKGD